jgi:hypothetical protein
MDIGNISFVLGYAWHLVSGVNKPSCVQFLTFRGWYTHTRVLLFPNKHPRLYERVSKCLHTSTFQVFKSSLEHSILQEATPSYTCLGHRRIGGTL